ncbi:hypothetical protein [Conexibacter sp. CPCC 206217]|uniref:5' nucleotidase, NT5C type n=1 Tax=Conexibacter sp. CPCC 206217 TaxID=3064574 RepID=UPI00271F2B9F|nr:hypothetical protein [Conexibacter sp. CPCC 206217]MDO8212810.1 hypothetical protein [Conexibacter sp. CPCC 206217]
MRIAIDIDSTLHNYWDVFSKLARKRFGVTLAYQDQVTYEIDRLRPEQVDALTAESHAALHVLGARPYEGAVETIAAWHETGHFIHITSHRAREAHEPTAQWLEQIGLPYDELYCSWDKISRCTEIEIDVLIDDAPVNILRAQEQGIVPATILHPWNRELCHEEGVIAASDWAELAQRLSPVLAGTAARQG